jgi:hypothetical protein
MIKKSTVELILQNQAIKLVIILYLKEKNIIKY